MNVHILTPLSHQTVASLVQSDTAMDGDLIADFAGFPCTIHKVGKDHTYWDITTDLFESPDYWAVVREWMYRFTEQTHLQDTLAIEGYSIWWASIYVKVEPSLSDFSNSFSWIDLLVAIREQTQSKTVIIYGAYTAIIDIVYQIFVGTKVQIESETASRTGRTLLSFSQLILIAARVGLSIICFVFNLIQHPDICFFASANLIRNRTVGQKQKLWDVYMGEIAQLLKARGWRITFVERFGINASWQKLWARRLFFPSDLLLALSHPRLSWLIGHRRIVRKWQTAQAEHLPSLTPFMRYRG